jgi:CheY-like chemotaxis protein
MRLEQVFSNILNNASKFTPRGGRLWLNAEIHGGETGKPAMAEVRIRDNGNGIDPTLLPRIFDLFVQGERFSFRGSSGLGLGLTLARQLVELHKGTIEAISPGVARGSEFVVRLPLVDRSLATAEVGRRPSRGATAAARRVLIVDDNVDATTGLRMLLEGAGHQVQVAHDGSAALALAASFVPEIILLDLSLPDMDGFEIARQLRRRDGPRPFIVAVSGFGRHEDVERGREAGIDEHFVKPVDADLLFELIENVRRT